MKIYLKRLSAPQLKCIAILGQGLLESTYRSALAHEFNLRSLRFQKEVEQRVRYKGIVLGDENYRVDSLSMGN